MAALDDRDRDRTDSLSVYDVCQDTDWPLRRSTLPRHLVNIVRYRLAEWLLAGPVRARSYSYFRSSVKANIISESTQIVIEGYPRSANSYALAAFHISNGKDIPVAHHLHSAVNVEIGVRRGMPVLVLLREPLDAASSLLLRVPSMPAKLALERYIRFYKRIVPLTSSVVIAPYDIVVSDFGTVLHEVNHRFGTSFKIYEPSADNEARAREEIEWTQFVHDRYTVMNELAVSRPSSERTELKSLAQAALNRYATDLAFARQLYTTLLAHARWPTLPGTESRVTEHKS